MSERASRWDAPASGEPAASASSSSNGAAAAPAAAAPAAGASSSNPGVSEAAQAAAAIAAKIAASLRPGVAGTELIKRNMDDEGFVKDIEVNDLRNRYVLTKASTQKQIEEETGASVVTKGVWVPDRTKLGPGEIPLYLHIVAQSQVSLDLAVRKVNELIDQELGPLIDERTMVARNRALGLPPPATLTDRHGRPKWPEAKLPIGLESMRNFNVRAKTVGPGGMFVKYIQAETGARVQIKGMGSGFLESDTGREAEEPMHINIAAPNQDQVDRASTLAADLLEVVRQEYEKARSGGGGPPGGMYNQGGYGGYQQGQQGAADPYAAYYQQQAGQPGATPDQSQGGATPAAGAAAGAGATPQQGTDAWAQYAAYWAAYGYDVNDPQFQAWQASQYGQQGQQQPGQQTPAA